MMEDEEKQPEQQSAEVSGAEAAQFFSERMVSEHISSDMCHFSKENTLTDDENDRLMDILRNANMVK